MKRALGVAMVLLSGVFVAVGQGPYSLQVADTAVPAQQNATRLTAGTTIGEDSILFGGRVAFYPAGDIELFGDLGYMDVRGRDGGPVIQAGGLWTMPLSVPFDTGLRGTVYKPFIDGDISIWGATGGVVAGRDLEAQVQGLSIYGYIGFDYCDSVIESPIGENKYREDLNIALAVGAVLRFAPRMSVYGELSFDDDPFIGAGLRMDL